MDPGGPLPQLIHDPSPGYITHLSEEESSRLNGYFEAEFSRNIALVSLYTFLLPNKP